MASSSSSSSTTTPKAAKGILKKPASNPANSSLATTATGMEEVPLFPSSSEEAYENARILATYAVIERLTALPSWAPDSDPLAPSKYTAASPDPRDAAALRAEVTKLTQGEFGELIAERNCEGKCGYVLCGRRRRAFANEFTIWRGKIAAAAHLNMWCSDDCARRALNVQLQLGATPLHGLIGLPPIELLGENPDQDVARHSWAQNAADLEGWQVTASDQTLELREKNLPLEPGMHKPKTTISSDTLEVVEKDVTTAPKPPQGGQKTSADDHRDHLYLESRNRFGVS